MNLLSADPTPILGEACPTDMASPPPAPPLPPSPPLPPLSPHPQPAHVRHARGRARGRIVMAACAASILGIGWWALVAPVQALPRDATSSPVHARSANIAKNDPPVAMIDLAAFRAPLWVAPPAPPPAPPSPSPPPAAPPPPPLNWQLLAIVGEQLGAPALRAMFYDPGSDAILNLAAGEEHTGRTVESIAYDRIVIRTGEHVHELRLDARAALPGTGQERGP